MYDDHYGLSGRPFALTPDPKFWFDTATHRKAMAYLGYGLSQGEGFIVITGDVGAGKTTLVGHLMATIDRERLHVIKLVSSQVDGDDLLRIVATGLGVETAGLMKAQLLVAIERGLHSIARAGRRTLLIVDEAQALHTGALEELRMLSNFQAGGHALLQIFLLGQPEFRAALHGSDRLEQLRQRVIAMHHLDPMGAEEVEPYVLHRLSLVGWNGRPKFTPDAFAALYRGSDGVPRRLNQLAGRVLLFGAIEQIEVIDAKVVDAVIADITGDMPAPSAPAQWPVAAAPEPKPEPAIVAAPEPIKASEPVAMREPLVAVEPAAPANDPKPAPIEVAHDRFAAIEARLEEQDAALRRVLALLVDWVEGNEAAAARGGRAA
ncbi:XrtA/PEP-CTERM system-associated ATPase [Sphingomonas asaccharolytica]|uniref:XrtA/PEP-CTERM system-associated ATPase n=1 Tax=Sphingomonas asaccharolytica TaxID=40681 RepID=UPI000833D751|nr:XrtA/PEP-CTERM system-associated ATPase [Sphingomonas asaccharolytica]